MSREQAEATWRKEKQNGDDVVGLKEGSHFVRARIRSKILSVKLEAKPMSVQVFISYSRSNFAYARLLHDLLKARLNCEIFMDLTSIDPGDYFPRTIEEVESSCSVVIVLIGKAWLSVEPSSGMRPADNPENWTRREVAAALSQNIRVIPVLLENVAMPTALDLPVDICSLANYNAIAVRDSEFDRDVERLVVLLEGEIVQDLVDRTNALHPSRLLADMVYYFPRFLKLIFMPKRFVRAYTANPEEELVRALIFLAISLVLFSAFSVPFFMGAKRMVAFLVVQFFLMAILTFCLSAVLQLSWRCVGGRAPLSRYLSINSYYSGVNWILGICLVAAAFGVVKTFDPHIVELLIKAWTGDIRPLIVAHPAQSIPLRVAAWIVVIGELLRLIWTFAFWGSYREINRTTRLYSAAAFFISAAISAPVYILYLLVQEGFMRILS